MALYLRFIGARVFANWFMYFFPLRQTQIKSRCFQAACYLLNSNGSCIPLFILRRLEHQCSLISQLLINKIKILDPFSYQFTFIVISLHWMSGLRLFVWIGRSTNAAQCLTNNEHLENIELRTISSISLTRTCPQWTRQKGKRRLWANLSFSGETPQAMVAMEQQFLKER